MLCPKCQFEQPGQIVCQRCGLIFEKYYRYHRKTSTEPKPVYAYATQHKRSSISQTPWVKALNTLVFYGSLLLFIVAFFKRNEFPVNLQFDQTLLQEPIQRSINSPAFDLKQNQINYQIKPLYQYQISGLVVSYRQHDGQYDTHKSRWGDYLNIADICVVWGDNVSALNLNAFTFWSGVFTCNVKTKDEQAWQQFNPDQLSNNHLLTTNATLRDIIADVHIGDQIHISGLLAHYSNDKGFKRGTSTTRTDTGNGACETIYVEDFRITRPLQNGWRQLVVITSISLLLSFIWWIYSIVRE